jgi:hypothetical protein
MTAVGQTSTGQAPARPRTPAMVGAAGAGVYVVLIMVGNTLAVEGGQEQLGLLVELAGFAAMMCFIAYLAGAFAEVRGWASQLAVVAGVIGLAVKLSSGAEWLAAQEAGVVPEVVAGLTAVNDAAFVVGWFPHGIFVGALALAGLSAGRFGRVLAGCGVVLGAATVLALPAAVPIPFLLSLLWLVAASVVLVRHEARDGRAWAVEV